MRTCGACVANWPCARVSRVSARRHGHAEVEGAVVVRAAPEASSAEVLSRALTTLTVNAMPTVTNTVTTTAADGSSTTVTKTETSDRFLLSPELAPDLEVSHTA